MNPMDAHGRPRYDRRQRGRSATVETPRALSGATEPDVTFVITQPCLDTKDQTCVDVCPVDCIHFEGDDDRMLYIDPVECIDCGACEPVCPVTAIFDDASVPEDQQLFTEVNTLWFQDPAAARARVADIPALEPAVAVDAAEATAEAAPAAASAAETAAAEVAAAALARVAATQVEAVDEAPRTGVIVPQHRQPSPLGLIAIAGLAVSFFVMWIFPGPRWLSVGGVGLHAGVLLAGSPALLFLLLFLRSQFRDLADFAAHHERRVEGWRAARADWRRSEESRLYQLSSTVQQIARERFHFPSEQFPHYQTHVNMPEPAMGDRVRRRREGVPRYPRRRVPGQLPGARRSGGDPRDADARAGGTRLGPAGDGRGAAGHLCARGPRRACTGLRTLGRYRPHALPHLAAHARRHAHPRAVASDVSVPGPGARLPRGPSQTLRRCPLSEMWGHICPP